MSRILEVIQSAFSSGSTTPRRNDDSAASQLTPQQQHQQQHELARRLSISLLPQPTRPAPEEIIGLDDDACAACADPCDQHSQYPSFLRINRDVPLDGTVKPYIKHVLISTARSDWNSYIEEESGSLAAVLSKLVKGEAAEINGGVKKTAKANKKKSKRNGAEAKAEAGGVAEAEAKSEVNGDAETDTEAEALPKRNGAETKAEAGPAGNLRTKTEVEVHTKAEVEPGTEKQEKPKLNGVELKAEAPGKLPRIIITNCSRSNSDNDSFFSRGSDVLLWPDNLLIRQVTTKRAPEFQKRYLSFLGDGIDDNNASPSTTFEVIPIPYKAVILICSHRRRDKRCGVTAPLLRAEFERELQKHKLDLGTRPNDGVGIYMCSHIGGHKYAGNVIVYRGEQGIWYGRVTPCHARAIVECTVIEGRVIQDLYRGSMNGSFGPGKGGRLEW